MGSVSTVLIDRFERLLRRPTHVSGESEVQFRYPHGETFRLRHLGNEGAWEIEIPNAVSQQVESLRNSYDEYFGKADPADSSSALVAQIRFGNFLENHLGQSVLMTPYFIPAGRAYFNKIERDVMSYFESANVEPFVSEFGKFYSKLRSVQHPPKERLPWTVIAKQLTQQLISGDYIRKGERDFIAVQDGRTLPASMWSSGQLEALPLALVLDRCCEALAGARHGSVLFIEEPEAHLFPYSQQLITQFIALAHNANQEHNSKLDVFLTTHSPYILTSINNLIKAGQLFSEDTTDKDRVAKIIPREFALNPNNVGAFYMDRSGCHSIISEETGLIDASAIDDVSGKIAQQFDQLLDLQFT